MQKRDKMRQKDVEVNEEIVYESVFIHLNTYQITQMFAFSS